MKIKEALKILSNSEIEEPVQAEALGQIEKSIIVKLVVVFIVGVVLLILSTVFLANNMARFSSTGAITILLSLLIFTLFISLAFLGYHLIGNVQKSYLIKSYKFYDFIQFIILAIILILFAQTFFIKTADVSGSSMEPTLHDGDKVFVWQLNLSIDREEIVVMNAIHYPNINPITFEPIPTTISDKYFVKRVWGLPGDSIDYEEFENHIELYVNDVLIQTITDNSAQSIMKHLIEEVSYVIPEHKYLLLGDNIQFSKDSRSFGFVDEKDILGSVHVRLMKWPWLLS